MVVKYITNVRIPTSRAQGYAIMKMCSEFAKIGAKVELFVPGRSNSKIKEDPFDFYQIKNNFNIKKISSFDFLGKTKRFGKIAYWVDSLSFFVSARFFTKINNQDVIYTRDFLTILFFKKYKNLFLELHDIPRTKLLFRWLIKKPKIIFVLNKNLKDELIKLGVSSQKIFIFPSGVDLEQFDIKIDPKDARTKMNLPLDKKIVMYMGHFYKWKGVHTLAEVAKSMPDVNFVFIGGVTPEIGHFISKYQDYKNIIVRPFVLRELVPTYLKSADVLVVPNSSEEKISSLYTSPLKLLEYMASSIPIVVSDLPSLREIVDESHCLFAKADNPESFKVSIENLLDDSNLSYKISSAARVKVEGYSWKKRAEDILSIISNTNKTL